MNADTISIIISVVTVGVANGALTMAGFKRLREDIREVRRDVNTLQEAVGALRERTGSTLPS